MLRLSRRKQTPSGPCLTPEELADFHRRFTAMEAAKANYVMTSESWLGWLKTIGEKYGVGTYFDVEVNTGRLLAKERPVQQEGA